MVAPAFSNGEYEAEKGAQNEACNFLSQPRKLACHRKLFAKRGLIIRCVELYAGEDMMKSTRRVPPVIRFRAKTLAFLIPALFAAQVSHAADPNIVAPVLSADPEQVRQNRIGAGGSVSPYPADSPSIYAKGGIPGFFMLYQDPTTTAAGYENQTESTFADATYRQDGLKVQVLCSENADLSAPTLITEYLSSYDYGLVQNPQYSGPLVPPYAFPILKACATTAFPGASAANHNYRYKPQAYDPVGQTLHYWTETSRVDGSGSKVRSNVVDVNLLVKPTIRNADAKVMPATESYIYPVYAAPGASGRIKIGSVVNPNVKFGFKSGWGISQPEHGLVEITDDGSIYYTPSADFGTGDYANQPESIVIEAYTKYPGDNGNDAASDAEWRMHATRQFLVYPYSKAVQGTPKFRFVSSPLVDTNVRIPGISYTSNIASEFGMSHRLVANFTPNVPEPTVDIYHTPPADPNVWWDPALVNQQYLYLFQTDGTPCPLVGGNGVYPDVISTARLYLAYQPNVKTVCVAENISSQVANNAFETQQSGEMIEDFYPTFQYSFRSTKPGKGTVTAKISEIDATGAVVGTQLVTYERTVMYPDFFDFTTTPNFAIVDGFYVVTDRNKDLVKINWNVVDLSNLMTQGSLKVDPSVKTFASGHVEYSMIDKRSVKPWPEPGNQLVMDAFNLTKETLKVSASSRRADGTIIVTFGPSEGDYTISVKRISASTGAISDVTLPDGALKYCTNAAGWSQEYYAVQKGGDSNCTGQITLPKALVNDVNMAEDRLVIQADAVLGSAYTNIDKLRTDDNFAEYFVRRFTIPGFEGNIGLPSGTLQVPNPAMKGKPIAAQLLNTRSIARVTWTVTSTSDPNFEPIVTTRRNANALDLSALPVGQYLVAADFYNEADETIKAQAQPMNVYSLPTVVLHTPTAETVGKTYNFQADVTSLSKDAVATWRVGFEHFEGKVSADGKSITGSYAPAQSDPAAQITLDIKLSPTDALSTVTFPGDKIVIADAPKGSLRAKALVFWVGKGEVVTFVGDPDVKRLDWVTTRPDGVTVTKSLASVQPYNTQDLLEGVSTVVAKAYNSIGDTYVTEPMQIKALKQPKATLSLPNAVPANVPATLTAHANNAPTTSTIFWQIGNEIIPATVDETGVISTPYTMPAVAGKYPSSLSIQVDSENPNAIVKISGPNVQVIAYTKILATVTPPSILDVGEPVTYKAAVKPSWDTKVLPLAGAGVIGEWELPDGTRVPGLNLNWTPTPTDYQLYLAGKKPIFRAWLDGAAEATLATVATNVTMLEPWIMPTYSLVPKSGGASVVAPATVVLKLTPSRTVPSSTLKYRGVKYEWLIPDSPNVTVKVVNDTATMSVNGAGTFPVSVKTSDRYGTEATYEIEITGTPATLSMTKLQFSPNPTTGRVPVDVGLKVATTSTHSKERVVRYVTSVDGAVVMDSKSIRPVRVTTPGDHAISVNAISNFGNEASLSSSFTAVPNDPPSCTLFKVIYGKGTTGVSAKANANCRDSDGKIKRYAWTVNGAPTANTGPAQSYTFGAGETSVEIGVTVTDDSGDSTTYSQVINKP